MNMDMRSGGGNRWCLPPRTQSFLCSMGSLTQAMVLSCTLMRCMMWDLRSQSSHHLGRAMATINHSSKAMVFSPPQCCIVPSYLILSLWNRVSGKWRLSCMDSSSNPLRCWAREKIDLKSLCVETWASKRSSRSGLVLAIKAQPHLIWAYSGVSSNTVN